MYVYVYRLSARWYVQDCSRNCGRGVVYLTWPTKTPEYPERRNGSWSCTTYSFMYLPCSVYSWQFSTLNGSPQHTVITERFYSNDRRYSILFSNIILIFSPTAICLIYISVLGLTAGAHRLWAHASFKSHTALKTFLVFAQTLMCQVRTQYATSSVIIIGVGIGKSLKLINLPNKSISVYHCLNLYDYFKNKKKIKLVFAFKKQLKFVYKFIIVFDTIISRKKYVFLK